MDLYIVHIYDKREMMLWIICLTICMHKDCGVLHCLAQCVRHEECDQLWSTQCGPYTLLVLSATLHTSTCGCINTYIYIHTYICTYVCMYMTVWSMRLLCSCFVWTSHNPKLYWTPPFHTDREPLTTASPPATHTRRQDISMYMLIWLARPSLASQTNLHVWAMNTQQGAILNMYPSHSMHTCHVAWEPWSAICISPLETILATTSAFCITSAWWQ